MGLIGTRQPWSRSLGTLFSAIPLLVAGCGEGDTNSAAAPLPGVLADLEPGARVEAAMEVALFANGLPDWRAPDEIASNAGAEMTDDGACRLLAGEPISAIRYEGPWELPVTDYEITFDARRVEGVDFFAALTFPVNSLDTCATFVPGGWGGAVTGISCIDDIDASANETASTYNYPIGEWFTFRIEVRPDVLQVWRGNAIIARVAQGGRRIGLRPGDIEYCAPFGLSTYMTVGEIRKLKIRSLSREPLWRRRIESGSP